jgi:hypothetical protein
MSWENPEEGADGEWDEAWNEDASSYEDPSNDYDYSSGLANLGGNLWGNYDDGGNDEWGEATPEWADDGEWHEGDGSGEAEWYDGDAAGSERYDESGGGEWYGEAGDY